MIVPYKTVAFFLAIFLRVSGVFVYPIEVRPVLSRQHNFVNSSVFPVSMGTVNFHRVMLRRLNQNTENHPTMGCSHCLNKILYYSSLCPNSNAIGLNNSILCMLPGGKMVKIKFDFRLLSEYE